MSQVDPPSALTRLSQATAWLVDVREPAEVQRAAFDDPRTLLMPLSEFERRHVELPRDAELILACASGGRSQMAAQFLRQQGHTQVVNLAGGLSAWLAHGLPVRRG
ncbi:MAG: rhodanese-like domain-containing protein [Vitreoscilla sp.]|nr:rhodanese-like domain-containing protein [Vitreoscilla sp.]